MTRDRFLLRADREAYTYREILELRPGSARLLLPSARARQVAWIVSLAIALAYVFVAQAFVTSIFSFLGSLGTIGLIAVLALLVVFFAGLLFAELWWDRVNLPILADNPRAELVLHPLGVRSFKTFLELRAKTDDQELRIAVHGSPPKVEEALRWTGFVAKVPEA